MSEQSAFDRVASLAKDRRAWIPFAVIGVLLLVLSTVIVVSLETREDPEPDVDEQLAFDRGEASAQAALRTAVRDAAAAAGDAPVTEVTGDKKSDKSALRQANLDPLIEKYKNKWNEEGNEPFWFDTPDWCPGWVPICDGENEEVTFEDLPKYVQENHIFKNYVRLQIYNQTSERFDGAGQEIRGTRTEVSLIDDYTDTDESVKEKIERVELDIGHRPGNDLGTGMVGATVKGVNISVFDGNELVDQRVETLNVSVGTTLFELHNRTQEYDRLLNTGFFDGLDDALKEGRLKGFGQEFALRLYPVAYAKSGVKYLQPMLFEEIASNRQSEMLANHAIYALQRDAFGVSDPNSGTEMRIATVCLATDIVAEKLAEKLGNNGGGGDSNRTEKINGTLSSVISNGDLAGNISEKIAGYIDSAEKSIEQLTDPEVLSNTICNVLRDTFGKGGEDPSNQLPSFSELLGGLAADEDDVNKERNVSINTSAALTYLEIVKGEDKLDQDSWKDWQDALDLENLTAVNTQIVDENGTPVDVDESINGTRSDVMKQFYKKLQSSDFKPTPGISEIRDRVFTVGVSASADQDGTENEVEAPELPSGYADGNWDIKDTSRDYSNDPTVTITDKLDSSEETRPERVESFYRVELSVDQTVTVDRTWVCVNESSTEDCTEGNTVSEVAETDLSAGTTVDIQGQYSPDSDLADDRDLVRAYTDGGETGSSAPFDVVNFDGAPEEALDKTFSIEATEGTLEDSLTEIDQAVDPDLIESEAGYIDNPSDITPLKNNPAKKDNVYNWLRAELERMIFGVDDPVESNKVVSAGGYPAGSLLNRSSNSKPSVDQVQVDLKAFMNDKEAGLTYELKEKVDEKSDQIVYQDVNGGDNDYENVPDLARAELYKEFVKRLEGSIETTEQVRVRHAKKGIFQKAWDATIGRLIEPIVGTAKDAADKVLSDILGSALDFGAEALGSAFNDGDTEEAGELDDTPLFEDVTFEIHGSPTFLSNQWGSGTDNTYTRGDTAAVRPGGAGRFAGLSSSDGLADNEMPQPDGTEYSTMYASYGNPIPYPGLPIIPGLHVAQASLWNVEVGGEYPRFAVSATTGDPTSTTAYVRENQTVSTTVDGQEVVGRVEPVEFESRTFLGVLMPPGGGVGDGTPATWTDPKELFNVFAGCSPTYPELGPDYKGYSFADVPGIPDELGERVSAVGTGSDKDPLADINSKVPIIDPIPQEIMDIAKSAKEQGECIGAQIHSAVSGLAGGEDD